MGGSKVVNSEDLDKLIEYIRSSKRIVFFGGAGVSTVERDTGFPEQGWIVQPEGYTV